MKGRLIDLSFGMNQKQRITVEVDKDFRADFDRLKGKPLDIEIKQHREKRSKDANAYFHVLVNKIAAETGESDSQVKQRLVLDYGTIDVDQDGKNVAWKVLPGVDVTKYYKYAKLVGTRQDNGVEFNCYLVYKHTNEMDSKEMARLIDGAISEAKELGIETATPEQIARFKEEWGKA